MEMKQITETTMFIFTRRCPRSLRIVISTDRPMITRRGTKRFVNYTEVTNRNVSPADFDAARRATRVVQKSGDYEDGFPVLDLELAAVRLLETLGDGWEVRHRPATAMFKEFIEIERK